jgi:hypothetical protein
MDTRLLVAINPSPRQGEGAEAQPKQVGVIQEKISLVDSLRRALKRGRLSRIGRGIGVMLAACMLATLASAQTLPTVNWYATSTAGGMENSNTIRSGRSILFSIGCFNYDTSHAKIVMLYDSTSVPANGTVPTMGVIPLAQATTTSAPGMNSMTIAQGEVPFRNGITFAASTTGETLTVDTTSGGNVYCVASYSPLN